MARRGRADLVDILLEVEIISCAKAREEYSKLAKSDNIKELALFYNSTEGVERIEQAFNPKLAEIGRNIAKRVADLSLTSKSAIEESLTFGHTRVAKQLIKHLSKDIQFDSKLSVFFIYLIVHDRDLPSNILGFLDIWRANQWYLCCCNPRLLFAWYMSHY